MDDGDGAFAIEMMAGQPAQAIMQTIYNGSATCSGCGAIMTPTTAMYTGTTCPDCMSRKAAKHVTQMIGK
jgi:DNA-directed RNA polymerase subunit RPC12/RpoP